MNPLCQELRQVKQQLESSASRSRIPDNWAEFAAMCKIRSGNKIIPFLAYDYQIKLNQLMDRYSVVMNVKSRQLGVTQSALSRYLYKAIRNPAYQAMAFMRNEEDSSNLSRRTRMMLESIPQYALPASDNLGYLQIKDGGAVYFKNSNKEGARSYDSVSEFLFDEAAFSPNIESIYSASSASSAMLGDDCNKLIVSTPSSKIGWYWEMLASNNPDGIDPEDVCTQVAEGNLPPFYYWVDSQDICKVVIHWKAHPIYSQREDYLEYRQRKDGTSWEVIQREYNLRFINPDIAVFDAALVKKCAQGEYTQPFEGGEYYFGVDTSNLGGDYTVCVVLEKKDNNYSIVAIYRQKKKSSEYDIYQIGELIEKYKPQSIGIETTGGTGQVYLEQLQKNHKNFHFEGLKTNQFSKPVFIDRVILAMEMNKISYPLKCPIIEEMLIFKRSGNQMGAPTGKHDDCLMALSFALAVTPFAQEKNKGSFKNVAQYW